MLQYTGGMLQYTLVCQQGVADSVTHTLYLLVRGRYNGGLGGAERTGEQGPQDSV